MRLKLRKPKSDKKVKWDADTVDNEHMNKRKSKCMYHSKVCVFLYFVSILMLCYQLFINPHDVLSGCCIYKKHRDFDESSSSESDDECENCYGHVEHRKKNQGGSEVPQSSSPVPCGSGKVVFPSPTSCVFG